MCPENVVGLDESQAEFADVKLGKLVEAVRVRGREPRVDSVVADKYLRGHGPSLLADHSRNAGEQFFFDFVLTSLEQLLVLLWDVFGFLCCLLEQFRFVSGNVEVVVVGIILRAMLSFERVKEPADDSRKYS